MWLTNHSPLIYVIKQVIQPQHLGMLGICNGSYEESGLHTQFVCFKAQILVVVFIHSIYATVFILEGDLLIRASEKRT